MVPDSSEICARSSRILSGSGSLFTPGQPHQRLPLFDVEHEVGLSAHQPLRGRGAVDVGRGSHHRHQLSAGFFCLPRKFNLADRIS